MITGVWHGKINRQKVEVKLILNGDSLTGTSYYFTSPDNYRRYSIKGYFDVNTNSAVWWDDQLVEEKSGRYSITTPGKVPLVSTADFNCPGGDIMMLDGKAAKKENENNIAGDVHLNKEGPNQFMDEWDFVIENYITGANDPDIIDSIDAIVSNQTKEIEQPINPQPKKETTIPSNPVPEKPEEKKVMIKPTNVEKEIINKPPMSATPVLTVAEKFATRKKEFVKELPLAGDTIELRFYDNAEIDGDSIALFLNGKLIAEHIRLTGNPHSIKIAVSELGDNNEMIMVAENMGAIPPNTSYMIAIIDGKRYDAYLASTEGSSAMIRFSKGGRSSN